MKSIRIRESFINNNNQVSVTFTFSPKKMSRDLGYSYLCTSFLPSFVMSRSRNTILKVCEGSRGDRSLRGGGKSNNL